MQVLDHEQVRARLPMRAAIDALETAIAAGRIARTPPRQHLHDAEQELLLMPSFLDGGATVKLVGIDPANPARGLPRIQGVVVVFDGPGLTPSAVLDAAAVTAIRTAAVSGLATRYLARPDSERLVLFGAGPQAHAHLEAMVAVAPVRHVRVVSRTPAPAAALVERARAAFGLDAEVAGPEAVTDADLVCACTTSSTPVFDGARLPRGVHVNAVGSYRPDLQELDVTTVRSCRVVVEDRGAALRESGDLAHAVASGWDPGSIAADLPELVRDRVVVRSAGDDRTLFDSVGLAYEDLIVAEAVVQAG
jgi:ornithine cyclodeaminase/alanine dehydrogenase-like protein (mu-crystallin family)